MARFHVYLNQDGNGYLIDIQADTLSHFNTRMVVPLLPVDIAPKPAKTLNPLFEINGKTCSMVTQYMAAVPARVLKDTISNAENRREDIVSAIDLLLQGF